MKEAIMTWLLTGSVGASPTCIWLFHDTWMNGAYNHMTDAIREFAAASAGRWRYEDLSNRCNGLGALMPNTKAHGQPRGEDVP